MRQIAITKYQNKMDTSKQSPTSRIEYLRVDSSVLMRIVRHEREGLKPNGCGQLLGTYEAGYIEVSDSYPLLYNDENVSEVARLV